MAEPRIEPVRPRVETTTPDREPLTGFALLRHGIALHSSPESPPLAMLADDELGPVLPVRIVADLGAWIEVELVPSPYGSEMLWPPTVPSHCFPTVTSATLFRLRFFVEHDALAHVLVRAIETTHPDGTQVRFEPGAWVHDDASTVATADAAIAIEIPPDASGFAYTPAAIAPMRSTQWITTDTDLAIGPAGRVPLRSIGATSHVEPIRRDGDRMLVEIRPRCVTARGWIAVQPLDDGHGAGVGGLPSYREGWKAKIGAAIRWRDGREAGAVIASGRLGPEREPAGKMRCFAYGLVAAERSSPESTVDLCFAADVLYEPKAGTTPDATVPMLARTCPPGSECSMGCNDWEGCAFDCRDAESCDLSCESQSRCSAACGPRKCILRGCSKGTECSVTCAAGRTPVKRRNRWSCR